MDYMTMRLLFPREAVLSLLDDPALKDNLSLQAERDVKPFKHVYLAIFVLQVEPVPEVGLRLRPVSTTSVGITKTASKSLIGRGFLWANTELGCASMDLLHAHYRGEESFVHRTIATMHLRMPSWRNFYRNCGGDLESVPDIVIADPGAEDMERMFGSGEES
jgi:hypothetical protein